MFNPGQATINTGDINVDAKAKATAAAPTYVEGTQDPLSMDLSGFLRTGGFIVDGVTPTIKATVAQFHNADNQALGTGNGLYTGGVTQILNSIGNLDRQRETGIDQIPSRGLITGAAQFKQEILATSTTTVTAGAATATLSVANTAGFQVGGSCNFEPSFTNVATGRYEPSLITAVVANTSVAVAFPTGGALFTHTQPYTIQTALYNEERDFSGEQQTAQGIGAAIASEFESNSGGPPLASGLSAGWTLDADRNIQGKNNAQMAISSTTTGDTVLTFTSNPWINANPLVIGQAIVLSVTANGAAVEQVIVSKNNKPVTGAGPIAVTLTNPVVSTGSLFATFDAFGLNVPTTASPLGTEDSMIWLYNASATDPKRPLAPLQGDTTNGAWVNIKSSVAIATTSSATATGGGTQYHLAGGTTASTNATSVKAAAAGTLYAILAINTTSTLGYLRLYDTAGAPTPSSATGAGWAIPVPSSVSGAGVAINLGPAGMSFTNGIAFAVTGGGSDTDNSNAPAGIFISLLYK